MEKVSCFCDSAYEYGKMYMYTSSGVYRYFIIHSIILFSGITSVEGEIWFYIPTILKTSKINYGNPLYLYVAGGMKG